MNVNELTLRHPRQLNGLYLRRKKEADTNQNQINIQSALAYNYLTPEYTDFLFAKLKGVSNLHIGRDTEEGIEELNVQVKNIATPQIENLVKKTVVPMCHIVLATATRFEGEWFTKFKYSKQRPFYKHSSQMHKNGSLRSKFKW